MKIAPTIVRDKLRNTVKDMDAMKELFVKDPESDFTRERSLPFKAMINMMLKFGGASLQNEISNTFIPPEKHPYACIPTKSAFIQQRNKILPEAGYAMLRSFSDDLPFLKKFDGKYRLFACDGSDCILRSPAAVVAVLNSRRAIAERSSCGAERPLSYYAV